MASFEIPPGYSAAKKSYDQDRIGGNHLLRQLNLWLYAFFEQPIRPKGPRMRHKISKIAILNYRSINQAILENCSNLNIIVGRNNSGKSNILSAIDLFFQHSRNRHISSVWAGRGRPKDEFFGRNLENPISIAVELDIDEAFSNSICDAIINEYEGVEKAIANLRKENALSIFLKGIYIDGRISIYVHDISFGNVSVDNNEIVLTGTSLMSVSFEAALHIIKNERELENLQFQLEKFIEAFDRLETRAVWEDDEDDYPRYIIGNIFGKARETNTAKRLQKIAAESESSEEFLQKSNDIRADLESQIDALGMKPLPENIVTYSGSVSKPPQFCVHILENISECAPLHFTENREPIGNAEALKLLRLKTTRGGPARLTALQSTVQSLLGVSVDAFEAEDDDNLAFMPRRRASRNAEMDIDDFLVDANGAGIREALRIVLDVELLSPKIVLVEEPEVHLHPGLENVMHRYLSEKSNISQIFVATHSTNFIDTTETQNVYVVSKDENGTFVKNTVQQDDIVKIPSEIGLRPSSVLMFDRLVFVEGPSDESIIREFAKTLEVNISSRNIGFVYLGVSSNISAFYSTDLIEIMKKRNVPACFIIDRDEKEEQELQKIQNNFGNNAKIFTLNCREIENYLLDSNAIMQLINHKSSTTNQKNRIEDVLEIEKLLEKESMEMKDKVIDMLIHKKLLAPMYPNRMQGANYVEKIDDSIKYLEQIKSSITEISGKISSDLDKVWPESCKQRAPGSLILDRLMKNFSLNYNKDRDAKFLASKIPQNSIGEDIKKIISYLSTY
ncbi:ATP-dependent endonuclease [Marinibaculum pumilum]|uniref:ATP-dependent endonuclease n=1 Tax=Marinibaculum pumilum TaxID=1766165 RepID=A0ABV7KXD7_9PROT